MVLLPPVAGFPLHDTSHLHAGEIGDALPSHDGDRAAGYVLPEHTLASIDSLQTESVFMWYTQDLRRAVLLDSLQFELGEELFRETDDSTFMIVALAGRRRLYAFNFIARMKNGSRLESGEQIDSLMSIRDTFQQYHMKRQDLITEILIGELQLLLQSPDYPGAFTCFFSALSKARETGYLTGEAHALIAIARLYRRLARIEDARNFYREALAIAARASDELALHRATEGLARLEILAGDPAVGLRMYEEVMDSSNNIIRRYGGFHHYFKGIARWKLGDTEGALQDLQLAAEWVHEVKLRAATLTVSIALGRVYESAGDTARARSCYQGVLDSRSAELTCPEVWEAAFRLGLLAEERGDIEESVEHYAEAIDIIEGLREGLGLEDLRLFFLSDKLAPYDRLIDLLYHLSPENGTRRMIEELALEYSERSRMRSFLSTVREDPRSCDTGEYQALHQQEDEVLHAINVLRIRMVDEKCTGENREEALRELNALKLKLSEVKLSLELAGRKHLREDRFADLTLLDEVREKILDSKTCIIEYAVGRGSAYVWIVKQDDIQMMPLPCLTPEYPPASLYVEILSQGEEPHFSVGERLFTDLIQPFFGDLEGMESVIFVPDEVLYHLPFESLPVPGRVQKDGRQRYLVDEYDISYAPSISTLLFLLDRKRNSPEVSEGIVAVGDPTNGDSEGLLDWITDMFEDKDVVSEPTLLELGAERYPRIKSSRDEVNRIVSFFPTATRKVILGDDANEAALKKEPLDRYSVVHFATHGLFDDEIPELSGLVLSGSPGEEDGFLLVDEIMRFELDAPMVVLSGCKTGLGRYIGGEGMVGLSRAFFSAGASSVVVSLWEIGDEATADFMEEFYRDYALGLGKCHALSMAKRKMIDGGVHPSVWAPFIFIGDYR